MPTSDFEILRGGPGTISGILPATALLIGTPMRVASVNADTGERTLAVAGLNGGLYCDGFLTRASRTTIGLTDTEQLFGLPPADGDGTSGGETPFLAGKEGSIEMADALEVEGTDYILTSGTGAMTSGTAVDSKLSFFMGKFRVAQTADFAQFRLKSAVMTPRTSGALRISVEQIPGYLVP